MNTIDQTRLFGINEVQPREHKDVTNSTLAEDQMVIGFQ